MVYLFIIYIYVKLSSSLPKDILYTTNSTVHCMTHAPFVIVCTLPYIWTIKNKDKVLFFLNLFHRLSDQSICIETKRTFKRKVNINKFLKHFNILLYTNWKKYQTNILHHINFMHDEYLCRGKREHVEIIDTRMFVYNATWPQSTYFFIVTSQTVFLRCLVYKIKSDHELFIEPMFVI